MNTTQSFQHEMTPDIKLLLDNNHALQEKRNSLTDIARNERICRVTIVKKEETRQQHLQRLQNDLLAGKKRPCCRPGCPHRNDNAKKRFSKKKAS